MPRRLSDSHSHSHLPANLQVHVHLQIRHQLQGSSGQSTPHDKNWTQHFTQTCYSSSISTLMNTTTISTRIQKSKSHPRLSSLRIHPTTGRLYSVQLPIPQNPCLSSPHLHLCLLSLVLLVNCSDFLSVGTLPPPES